MLLLICFAFILKSSVADIAGVISALKETNSLKRSQDTTQVTIMFFVMIVDYLLIVADNQERETIIVKRSAGFYFTLSRCR